MNAGALIVVSGLPASGKSTLGHLISESLSLPLIDKDTVLEALFDSLGCETREQRQRLSRASDDVVYALAAAAPGAVLVNWWHHDTAPSRLRALSRPLLEVHCACSIDITATRFTARQRHRGHLDHLKTPEELAAGIAHLRATYRGPLGVSDPVVTVDTSVPVDEVDVMLRIRAAIADLTL